jgi:SnoaL-like protein
MNGFGTDPTEDLRGRQTLTSVFEALRQYEVTIHFNGQSTVRLDGERATGEVYCVAHHAFSADGGRKIMLAYLRYIGTYVKQSGAWLFAERNLYLEFSDTRPLGG